MSLESFVSVTAIPECFERLQADAERMRSDLERLQRFVELSQTVISVSGEPGVVMLQQEESFAAPAALASLEPPTSPAAPDPMEEIPPSPSGRSRAEMEAAAQEAAREMVRRMTQAIEKSSTAARGLAWAICVMRDASQGFQCPQTLYAIWKALDDMPTDQQAITEGQANG